MTSLKIAAHNESLVPVPMKISEFMQSHNVGKGSRVSDLRDERIVLPETKSLNCFSLLSLNTINLDLL